MAGLPEHIQEKNTKIYFNLLQLIEDKPLLHDYFHYQYRSDSDRRINLKSLEHYLRLQILFFEYAADELHHDFLSYEPSDAKLDLIEYGFIDQFLNDLPTLAQSRVKKFNGSTPTNYKISVNSFFNWAYEFEYINRNHIKKSINRQRKNTSDNEEITVLDSHQTTALLNLAANGNTVFNGKHIELTKKELQYHKKNALRNHAIVAVMVYTGARLSEVANININDIDFYTKKIRLFRKGEKFHSLKMPPYLIDVVTFYIDSMSQDQKDCPALFSSKYGGEYNRISSRQIGKIVKKYLDNISPGKFTPHKLRATLATYLLNKGYDLFYVGKILNHSTSETTKRYTKADQRIIDDTMDHIDYDED